MRFCYNKDDILFCVLKLFILQIIGHFIVDNGHVGKYEEWKWI